MRLETRSSQGLVLMTRKQICEHGRVGFAGVVRRFSPPLSSIVSFMDFLVFRYDNDNYRYCYRYRRLFGLIVSK